MREGDTLQGAAAVASRKQLREKGRGKKQRICT